MPTNKNHGGKPCFFLGSKMIGGSDLGGGSGKARLEVSASRVAGPLNATTAVNSLANSVAEEYSSTKPRRKMALPSWSAPGDGSVLSGRFNASSRATQQFVPHDSTSGDCCPANRRGECF